MTVLGLVVGQRYGVLYMIVLLERPHPRAHSGSNGTCDDVTIGVL